jgi:hypothetical protein
MNKKDIALTVGGVLATMVLAYLLYQLQQRDAAAAAANAANASAEDEADAEAEQEQEYSLSSQLPQVSVGTTSTGIDTVNDDTDPTSDDTGGAADTSADGLLSSILADFTSSIANPVSGQTNNASIIPTVNSSPTSPLSAIPTTAQQAQAGVPSNTITPQNGGTVNGAAPSQPVAVSPQQPTSGGLTASGYNIPVLSASEL